MAVIQNHKGGPDWCHCCGERSNQTADIWFPRASVPGGAEWAPPELHRAAYGSPPSLVSYIRVCAECARAMLDAATGAAPGPVIREPSRRRR